MSDSWLENCISYNLEHGMGDSFASDMYKKELEYRIQNKISIKE